MKSTKLKIQILILLLFYYYYDCFQLNLCYIHIYITYISIYQHIRDTFHVHIVNIITLQSI